MLRATFLLLALFGASSGWADDAPATDGASVQRQLRDFLFQAARSGDRLVLSEFIAAGYNLDTADEQGYTALILAAYNGRAEAVEQLLDAGANACLEDRRGNTALMGAIFKGELAIARRLLATDCDPDQRNAAGQTPAMYAALFKRTEVLQALRQRGIDETATDALGNSVERLARGELNGTLQR